MAVDATLQWVAYYRSLGWSTVRVPPLSKATYDTDWPQRDYPPEAFSPGDNIGIKTGTHSNGLIDVDLDCPEAIALAPRYLPGTAIFGRVGPGKTPGVAIDYDRAGPMRHWLYRCATKTKKPARSHVEIRSTGLQTVFPGSIHTSGVAIEWYAFCQPRELTEVELHSAVGRLAFATILARAWPNLQGVKHHSVLALAGALWHAGWTIDDALSVLLPPMELDGSHESHREQAIRSTWADDDKPRTGWPTVDQIFGPVDAKAMQRTSEMVPTIPRHKLAENADGNGSDPGDLHDVGNAERFLRDHGEDLRYVTGLGWLQWDGARWAENEPCGLVIRSIRALGRLGEETKNPALLKWCHASLSAGRVNACESLASKMDKRATGESLDVNPWVLNCPNGLVDLRSGQLLAHARAEMITKMCGVPFDPTARAPRFARFLTEIFAGDVEVASYVLRFLGYALTGDVREQVFQVWFGHGANGKSTLIELLLYVLGDYAQRMSDDLLTARKFGKDSAAPSPDVARLRGARFSVGSEAGEGLRWNEPLVKTLTGSDRIVARHLHREPIEFRPTWKLALAVNHKPIVRGTDHGIWRRIHLVPFEVRFEGARLDATLPAQLAAEAPGVLAMLVRGCLDWQHFGLAPPSKVLAAVRDYREEHDVIGAFLGECTRVNPRASIPKPHLYRLYRTWAQDNGEYMHGRHAFSRLISDRRVLESSDGGSWIEIEVASGSF